MKNLGKTEKDGGRDRRNAEKDGGEGEIKKEEDLITHVK
jgi:hypothetical protein